MSKTVGVGLIVLAAILVASALVLAAMDVVEAARMRPRSVGEEGFRSGMIFGILIRTAILGVVSVLLYRWGLGFINPTRYSAGAVNRSRLEEIYESEKLRDRTGDPIASDIDYADHSDEDLIDVYRSIDRMQVPGRFESLLSAIKERVEAMDESRQ